MLDFADLVAINKFDKRGAADALRDVKKQYQRNHGIWEADPKDLPVYGTIASQFNDPGMNRLYSAIMLALGQKGLDWAGEATKALSGDSEKIFIIPPARTRYLSEISENNRAYDTRVEEQARIAERLYGYYLTILNMCGEEAASGKKYLSSLGLDGEALQNAFGSFRKGTEKPQSALLGPAVAVGCPERTIQGSGL